MFNDSNNYYKGRREVLNAPSSSGTTFQIEKAPKRRLNYSASDARLHLNKAANLRQKNYKRLTIVSNFQPDVSFASPPPQSAVRRSNSVVTSQNIVDYKCIETTKKDSNREKLWLDDTVITTIPPSPQPVYSYATIIESPPPKSSSYKFSYSQRSSMLDESQPTPTKYTYEHTNSFDSGIPEFESPQLSPTGVHDLSSHSLREVKTKFPRQKMSVTTEQPTERRFLKKVQRELEDQRTKWEGEVESLSDSFSQVSIPSDARGTQQGENSYVDTSSGKPIFKAFVDVSHYAKRSISVNVDSLANKVIVTAVRDDGRSGNHVTNTFTQKIKLPRFADEQNLKSHLSKNGILKIEVPLIYYFQRPDDAKERDRKAKSFVYQVENQHGQKVLEILVNTGSEYSAKQLRVMVQDDNKLVIVGEKILSDNRGHSTPQQKLIKQYSLPDYADIEHITSKMGKDGRLQVNVPLFKK